MSTSAPTDRSFDLARTTFQLLALGALIASSVFILRPFLVSLTWAITIVVATWPLLGWTQARLGGRRGLAAVAMTVALLLVFVGPFTVGVMTVVSNAGRFTEWAQWLATAAVPPPPAWVANLPAVGAGIAERWHQVESASRAELSESLAPYARAFALVLVSGVGGAGRLLVELLLTVLIAGILYSTGDTAARGAAQFARRLAGRQGEDALHLAGQAVRAVALGVVVTAIVQSSLAGLGLMIAGVPFAGILTVAMFILSVAQVGPAPVLIPAIVWLFVKYGAVWGVGLLGWAIVCLLLDNVLRPLLIKRGADVPLLLIFAGVIGGLLAFGVIGLFIGPVVLAVTHALAVAWVSQERGAEEGTGLPR